MRHQAMTIYSMCLGKATLRGHVKAVRLATHAVSLLPANRIHQMAELILWEYSIPQRSSITETDWLMLFKEITAASSENDTKLMKIFCSQNPELLSVK
jgi:hypothetical protein